ncbi:pirin family protein [Plebeiibacterium marinum]|uniref:Pirin family protein n=1 Tax=Plebeiibacterium marinum TaxID=2992111 RepID=A0AAE3MFB9_9BACT|nr:pirin family protein [Plebeiobacterium marinum]MCW3806012.1 pirin family protein [Plebeiobacterium marinum]
MEKILYRAEERGRADHGWLRAWHSFSFANYYHPEKINFGVLRVLNDDFIAPGGGFGEHPHDNMEIVTIPLSGSINHKDSMGNDILIREGEIQVMSAGSGIFHSEFNPSPTKELNLFQIWIIPDKRNVTPRYSQVSIKQLECKNDFFQIVSPEEHDQGAWIHQNAWVSMGVFDENVTVNYSVKDKCNGVYLMVVEGEIELDGVVLKRRDAIGLKGSQRINLKSLATSKVLLLDVPMNI